MSVANLLTKVSPKLFSTILSKVGLTYEQVKGVKFTFDDFGGPAGTTITHRSFHRPECRCGNCHSEIGWTVNIDPVKCREPREGGFYNVLAHELCHVHQNVIGRYGDHSDPHVSTWDGAAYKNESGIQQLCRQGLSKKEAFDRYQALPWEKDATERATRIFKELVDEGFIRRRKTPTKPLPKAHRIDEVLRRFFPGLLDA